ncbi:uncharacterized protein LOC126898871 [Daktulosphaira vitifoliae]|uniref:uncharacterized protein LOC126898871 n=1 Tax=Daktulosphaira vitifoliae TaxID=58002 RepID=UPI0021A9CC01|nr:uncharacterized protein LOC126898871 [Daktulosphaira vitifoliae]
MEDCPICKITLTNDLSKVICCKKIFHFKCIDDWLRLGHNCPTCRQIPFEKCIKCKNYLISNVTEVQCCKTQLHQKCLNEWLTDSIMCRICQGDLISDYESKLPIFYLFCLCICGKD